MISGFQDSLVKPGATFRLNVVKNTFRVCIIDLDQTVCSLSKMD